MPEIKNTAVQKRDDLSVTLNNEKFAELILNFLGKKEKLRYQDKIKFLLRLNDIEQFHYLLIEKIKNEQNVQINHFQTNFIFNDKTEREISSIESLSTYLETRDVYPLSVTMTWNIIINFPMSENVETQTIEITFLKNLLNDSYFDFVTLVISHTNQSWGNEVLNMFVNQIKKVECLESKRIAFYRKLILEEFFSKSTIIMISLCIGMAYSLFLLEESVYTSFNNPDKYLEITTHIANNGIQGENLATLIAIEKLRDVSNKKELEQKVIADPELLNIYNKSIDNRKDRLEIAFKQSSAFIVPLLLIYLIKFYLKKVIDYYGQNSYILTTARAEKMYEHEKNEKSKLTFYSISFIFYSILIGVVAGIITTFFHFIS